MNRRSFLRRSAFALALLLPWKRDSEAAVVEADDAGYARATEEIAYYHVPQFVEPDEVWLGLSEKFPATANDVMIWKVAPRSAFREVIR